MISIAFCLPLLLNAQVERNGNPISWSLESEIDVSVSYVELEGVDYEALIAEDAVSSGEKDAAARFAFGHTVLLNLDNSGRWVTLNNGDRVWMLGIQASNAFSVGVTFGEFYLPRGAKMFIYSQDRTDVIGAITEHSNNDAGILTTRPVHGGEVIIEYYEPLGVRGLGELEIRTIAEAYRDEQTEFRDVSQNGMCQQNVSCLQNREMEDRADATVMVLVDDGTRWMTGTMMNNTQTDERPLLITKGGTSVGQPEGWVFVFDYLSKYCDPSARGNYNRVLSGASLLAEHTPSEMALYELNAHPPGNWNVFYAGWSRKNERPTAVYSMHHPEGDVMKYASSDVIENEDDGFLPSWKVNWTIGTTEKGAVGCSLFNQNGLVIGSFQYGDFSCENAGLNDTYSKFSSMWSSFKDFLDPEHANEISLSGKFGGIEPSDSEIIESNIAIFPNPATDFITIYNGNEADISNVRFYDVNGRICGSAIPQYQRVNISELPAGVYFMEIVLEDSFTEIRKIIVQ